MVVVGAVAGGQGGGRSRNHGAMVEWQGQMR